MCTGTCTAHASPKAWSGVWVSGSGAVSSEGGAAVCTGDIGVTDCGHTFQAVIGSGIVTAEGRGLVRVGDPVIVVEGGSGTAVSGSSTVTSE